MGPGAAELAAPGSRSVLGARLPYPRGAEHLDGRRASTPVAIDDAAGHTRDSISSLSSQLRRKIVQATVTLGG